jgi:predicted transglutaminase-like cysteine proteinase
VKRIGATGLLLLGALQVSCIGTNPSPTQAARLAPGPAHLVDAAAGALADWRALLDAESSASEAEKLARVNAFFNRLRFAEDRSQWQAEDYWATPRELLRRNAGDCEDLVIGKYFTLRELDVPDERLRITYVIAGRPTRAHMVLAYYPTADGEPLILDNLTAEIRAASGRPDLAPVFGFNANQLWVDGALQTSVSDPRTRLGQWRRLLDRMEAGA